MATTPFTFIDTNTMPWEDSPGIPGYKRRLLAFDDATRAEIRMGYVPPGAVPDVVQLPHRHYHNSVTERAYHLFGDFPHWEFSGVRDDEGELVMFRRHLFMDRQPKSIHGLMAEPLSETGSVILYWNTGPGTGVAEPEAAKETVAIPFDGSADDDRTNFAYARIFDSGDVAWQKHPMVAGWKVKPLAEGVEHSGAVCLVHIPADWTALGEPSKVLGGQPSPWLFIISGDIRVDVGENGARHDLALREGGFLLWRTGEALSVPHKSATDGGCVVLCIGHDLSKTVG